MLIQIGVFTYALILKEVWFCRAEGKLIIQNYVTRTKDIAKELKVVAVHWY